jgi:hypothetical protein
MITRLMIVSSSVQLFPHARKLSVIRKVKDGTASSNAEKRIYCRRMGEIKYTLHSRDYSEAYAVSGNVRTKGSDFLAEAERYERTHQIGRGSDVRMGTLQQTSISMKHATFLTLHSTSLRTYHGRTSITTGSANGKENSLG